MFYGAYHTDSHAWYIKIKPLDTNDQIFNKKIKWLEDATAAWRGHQSETQCYILQKVHVTYFLYSGCDNRADNEHHTLYFCT